MQKLTVPICFRFEYAGKTIAHWLPPTPGQVCVIEEGRAGPLTYSSARRGRRVLSPAECTTVRREDLPEERLQVPRDAKWSVSIAWRPQYGTENAGRSRTNPTRQHSTRSVLASGSL
jgi:hypothetical protein